jgi:hypothetical protein
MSKKYIRIIYNNNMAEPNPPELNQADYNSKFKISGYYNPNLPDGPAKYVITKFETAIGNSGFTTQIPNDANSFPSGDLVALNNFFSSKDGYGDRFNTEGITPINNNNVQFAGRKTKRAHRKGGRRRKHSNTKRQQKRN